MTLHTNHYEEIKALRIEEFDYPLPDARIAKHPLAAREQCKLLHWHTDGTIDDRHFYDV
ncbi:MAG: S-adenosylmethionine:tRNA ribosyltransferase-isomerase, partial [Muribaculaceae bacterium]|nr:S-adenosylmethionine:tRNA ribosyltransferase-isomerase [Muribaculaceae bacterium]